jgi:hypothetical protein
MNTINIEQNYGNRWGYAFLITDTRLNEEEREYLLREAVFCFLEKQKTRKVKGERFEGRMSNPKKVGVLGSFIGYRFKAEIEGDFGKAKLEFLIADHPDHSLN